MFKHLLNLRNMAAKFACLAVLMGAMAFSANAQDYVGTYSGTLTITPIVYTIGDISNINTTIDNQELEVLEHNVLFQSVPIFIVGEPVAIEFTDVEFATDGTISAPDIDGYGGNLTFSIVSGNVSGNTIELTFRMVDKITNGMLANVTGVYTGTKQTSGIKQLSVESAMKVYPNPAKDNVTVSLSDNTVGTFAVFDLNGKVVKNQAISGTQTTISTASLAQGTYIIRLVKDGVASSGIKFVKE
jgi:hypothetical protein